ncbi:hypothetical protein MASR1M59_14730 [Melaminivora sp.]
MQRKKLPIGIQTFAKIREDDYYYVDKTALALKLIDTGTHYFLSRPRRFGKSLFLDTLAELFEGNESLFRGLQCHGRWDWTQRYPVIRLSFGAGRLERREQLDIRIHDLLRVNAERLGLPLPQGLDVPGCFGELIRQAERQAGQRVVVLVDEYDKPILDNLTEPAIARQMRDGLRDLYSVIKDNDAHIRFAFLTGVSKFSKVSIFSGLNNLRDITLSSDYSALCGYTDEDVDTVFAPELPGLDRQQIRAWYNGYNWTGTSVYNPFDLLLLFEEREFRLLLVRDRHADIFDRRTDPARHLHARVWQQLRSVVLAVTRQLRCRSHWHRGAAVANRLSDHRQASASIGARTEYLLSYPNLEVQGQP